LILKIYNKCIYASYDAGAMDLLHFENVVQNGKRRPKQTATNIVLDLANTVGCTDQNDKPQTLGCFLLTEHFLKKGNSPASASIDAYKHFY
jgi:hypothetical protein